MLPEPVRVTLEVVSTFEHLGIRYLIGGSFASAVYGVVRATMDVVLVADIKPEHIPHLVSLLEGEFYIDAEMILGAIQHGSSFNLIHLETMFKVDVFILKQRSFELNQMQRRISQPLGDSQDERAYFSSAEDIILNKMEWYREGGEISDRQWRDIIGVLEIQGEWLDFKYLQKWASVLKVEDLLRRAFQIVQNKGGT